MNQRTTEGRTNTQTVEEQTLKPNSARFMMTMTTTTMMIMKTKIGQEEG